MRRPSDAECDALKGMEVRIRVVPIVGGKPLLTGARTERFIVEAWSEGAVFVHKGFRPKRRGGVFTDPAQLSWAEIGELQVLHPATVISRGGTEVRQ